MFVRNGYLYIIRMMCITRLNIECRYHFVIGHDSIFTFRHSLSPDSCVMRFIRTVFYAETQFFRPSQSDRVIFPESVLHQLDRKTDRSHDTDVLRQKE